MVSGVLHVHDLGVTLRKKSVKFKEGRRIFEVCNPVQVGKVLGHVMRKSRSANMNQTMTKNDFLNINGTL